jgi:hypothetical protein
MLRRTPARNAAQPQLSSVPAVTLLAAHDAAYAQDVRNVQACQVSIAELERASSRRSHAQVAACARAPSRRK